jgi:hypothetical protein
MVLAFATNASKKWLRSASLFGVFAAGVAIPAASQGPALAMLDQLESGRWELRSRDTRSPAEQLCVQNGRRLIQLRHPGPNCERMIVADGPSEVTVQYTCRGRGYGRTHIRRETGRLVQIDSQGILDGLPFDVSAEGRRIGDCAGS